MENVVFYTKGEYIMKLRKKLALLLCGLMLMGILAACGGKTDAFTGTWKQTDEVNGNWTWTFSDGSKAKLVGETTGFQSEGTYKVDESAKKITITLKDWSETKEYSYTLDGNNLELKEKYSGYKLKKQ